MRLTHKYEHKDKRKNKEPMLKIRNKLFNLENIEEELGIDLITLFKALKNGVWYKEDLTQKHQPSLCVHAHYKAFCIYTENDNPYYDLVVFTKDYGKTWALTKEELL